MMTRAWVGIGSVFLFLVVMTPQPLWGQGDDDIMPPGGDGSGSMGPVGGTDAGDATDDAAQGPGWKNLSGYGLAGQVDEREPNEACEMCFTVPNGPNTYQIYEYLETDGPEGARIVSRMIPNPAPVQVNEIRPTVDAEGEPIWYIGAQGYVGPTDEERWADEAPLPTIELKRIQERHYEDVMTVPGVQGYGIGPEGFHVTLSEAYADNLDQIPETLEGVPVTVEIIDDEVEDVAWSLHSDTFRPLPAGASIGAYMGSLTYSLGSLGPHVVRDAPQVRSCCKFWSLTNAHIVKNDVFGSGHASTVYQPSPLYVATEQTIGNVIYAFTLLRCDTPQDRHCYRAKVPRNNTDERPDVAIVDTTGGLSAEPFSNPSGTEPIRRLQYRSGKYVIGP